MDKREESVSYFTFEAEMARAERTIKRLCIAIICLVGVVVVNNIAWLILTR